MMGGMGGGMGMGRPAPRGSTSVQGEKGEKPVQIEHTKNEGDTVDILNNIQVQKQVKKKPKKINFDEEEKSKKQELYLIYYYFKKKFYYYKIGRF